MTNETKPEEPGTESGASVATGEAASEALAKLNQTVEIQDIGPCKKHIKITIDRDDIDERLDQQFSELVVDAPVAGFRPGKAPRKIIERRFRKDVTDQVKGQLLMQSLEQLAEEHDIAPLSAPDIDPTKLEIPDKGAFVYEFDVEVRPHFDLPNYRGLKLRRPVQTFTDADIAVEERRLLAPYGQVIPKPEPAQAELDDRLTVDVKIRAGAQVVTELKEMVVRVDERLAFKDAVVERFAEKVIGAKVGEARTVDVMLSDRVANAAMRGQKLQGTFEIKDIKTVRLPELTHELCHHFGVHSPDQLRELIRVILERRLEYAQRQAARQQVLEQLAVSSDWELPQDLLVRQARRAFNSRIMEMRSSGISDEEIKARQRLLEQDVLQTTAAALKEHFVLQKIAELEKIDINEEDIDDEIDRIASQNEESPRRVRARLEKEELMDALATEIIERKALDLVLQSAEYEDVPVGRSAETAVATVEEQAVPGEMQDPTAAPAAEEAQPPTAPS